MRAGRGHALATLAGREGQRRTAPRGPARTGRPPRTGGPRRPRSSPRCPCTARAAARSAARPGPPPRPPVDRAGRCWPRRRRRARSSAPRPRGRADRLGHEDVDDGVLEAPRELGHGDRRGAAAGSSAASPCVGAASVTIRRAAVLRPEKLKSYESPIHARGNTTSRRVAPAAAAWIAGPPGYPRPSSRPTLSNASPGGVVDGRAEEAVRQVVAHLDEERVPAADTTSATSGKTGSGRAASSSPGSSSQAA